MGGKIAIGIRRSPDQFETITAWTNPLPRIVKAKAFIEGDFREFDEYIAFYREDRNQQGYGPSRHVPSEYGYILFDFAEMRMASAGHYTFIDRICRTELEYNRRERLADITALIGQITHRIEDDVDVALDPLTIADFPCIATFDFEYHPRELYTNYRIQYPGWRVAASGSSQDDFRRVYFAVAELAALSDEDRQEWSVRIAADDPVV
jgi:hypothetical protein